MFDYFMRACIYHVLSDSMADIRVVLAAKGNVSCIPHSMRDSNNHRNRGRVSFRKKIRSLPLLLLQSTAAATAKTPAIYQY